MDHSPPTGRPANGVCGGDDRGSVCQLFAKKRHGAVQYHSRLLTDNHDAPRDFHSGIIGVFPGDQRPHTSGGFWIICHHCVIIGDICDF